MSKNTTTGNMIFFRDLKRILVTLVTEFIFS